MLFPSNRDQLRQFYCDVWRKHRDGLPLEPLELLIRDVVLMHPEYQPLLERPDGILDKDYLPDFGETNPFLHMGLHLAIREQLDTGRPAGIRGAVGRLRQRYPDPHELDHRIMDCLAEMLWLSQRNNTPPDEAGYLDCLHRMARR